MKQECLKEDRKLSDCETLIMKAVWDAGEDIAISDLLDVLRIKYGKDYARTTMATFLLKLSEKEFIRTYRKGKQAYVHMIKEEAEYKERLLEDEINFWYKGNASNLVAALCTSKKLSRKDLEEIGKAYDELDELDGE